MKRQFVFNKRSYLFPLGLALILILAALTPISAKVQADGAAITDVLSAGLFHTCALRPSGAVDCWGNNDYGQAAGQTGPYTQVSAGLFHTCALTPTGAVDCWGDNSMFQAMDQPGPYTQVNAGNGAHTCALRPDGAVDCWGRNLRGQVDGVPFTAPFESKILNYSTPFTHPGPYTQISAGGIHTCALTPTGAIDCWGVNYNGEADDHPGPYTQVSTGESYTCALTPSGAVECWGANYEGEIQDKPGPYTQLSAGAHHACALTSTGAVECWGSNIYGESENQPGPYTQISGGWYFTCALTPSGAADCWGAGETNTGGPTNYGQAVDQSGPYGPYVIFTGFSSPIDNNGVLNIAKAGQTIPLKWRMTDAFGNPITNLTSVTVTALSLPCTVGTTTDTIEEYTSGASGLQNLGDGYYQWNWKTPTSYANCCKTLRLDLGDGLYHIALLQFGK